MVVEWSDGWRDLVVKMVVMVVEWSDGWRELVVEMVVMVVEWSDGSRELVVEMVVMVVEWSDGWRELVVEMVVMVVEWSDGWRELVVDMVVMVCIDMNGSDGIVIGCFIKTHNWICLGGFLQYMCDWAYTLHSHTVHRAEFLKMFSCFKIRTPKIKYPKSVWFFLS